ncbi:hypothetical protein [Pedobacter sp. ASV28]|uniref:hypothetical protein n=1 Tax=Pedobacter sp. ASV28 TaxID=2795123 RepID=UPI0018EC5685|nr:hypothetical protein [Pedobacter sp. ASV28]
MKKRIKDMPKASEKVAGNIASAIRKVQGKWAGFMKRKTDHLSIAAQKRWLIFIIALFGSFCMYLIVGGLNKKSKRTMAAPSTIMIPKLQEDSRPLGQNTDSIIVHAVKDYYHKRDSLMRFAPEQWQWLIDNRPGLIDSMEQLELYIQSNGLYKP